MVETAQCARRAACNPNSTGLFLTMVEPWTLKLSLEGGCITNPNQPFSQTIKKNSLKQECTSIVLIQYAQLQTCLHKFFATYNILVMNHTTVNISLQDYGIQPEYIAI